MEHQRVLLRVLLKSLGCFGEDFLDWFHSPIINARSLQKCMQLGIMCNNVGINHSKDSQAKIIMQLFLVSQYIISYISAGLLLNLLIYIDFKAFGVFS